MPRIDVSSLTLSRSFSRSRRIRSRASSPRSRKKAVASFISPNIYIVMDQVKTRAPRPGRVGQFFIDGAPRRRGRAIIITREPEQEGYQGMPYSTDGLVGKLALQKGIISAEQLKDCLAEQAAHQKSGQKRPLGVIMVGKGLMKDEDLLGLLEEQKKVLAERSNYTQVRRDDFLFGQILLKQGVATSGEINEALRLQAEAAERGEMDVPRLGQILIEMGVTEESKIQQTLKLQYKTLYECPGCTLKYNLVDASGEKQYRCKKCDAILVP